MNFLKELNTTAILGYGPGPEDDGFDFQRAVPREFNVNDYPIGVDKTPWEVANALGAAKHREDGLDVRNLKAADVSGTLTEKGVLVDTIEGHARVTGLLHNMADAQLSYATVSVLKGPAKVWVMSGQDFRTIVASKPEFMFDILAAMATELRRWIDRHTAAPAAALATPPAPTPLPRGPPPPGPPPPPLVLSGHAASLTPY